MPRKSEKIPINNKALDRRVKLTDKQREEIKKSSLSSRALAKAYGVSRRTIQFIQDPEKLEQCKKRRAERGGSKIYYNREKNNKSMKEHRQYKEKLYKAGLLKPKKEVQPRLNSTKQKKKNED